jgi:hypothetical protein
MEFGCRLHLKKYSGNYGDVKLGTTVRHGGLEDCVICMDKLTAPRKLRCGHIFCEECIGQYFKIKPVQL